MVSFFSASNFFSHTVTHTQEKEEDEIKSQVFCVLGAAWRHCECFLMKNPSSQTSVCIAAVASGAASIYIHVGMVYGMSF